MKKIFVLILALICIVSLPLFLNKVSAVEYYEWVQNPSFEPYINYFEDAGAESGVFNAGVQYGNFSTDDTWQFVIQIGSPYNWNPHSGLRFFNGAGNTESLWYNLTESKIGADIINCSVYEIGVASITAFIYYTDGTSDSLSIAGSDSEWQLKNMLGSINDAKYITAFKFSCGSANYNGLDDFVLYDVDDDAQEWVNYNTLPWYEPRIWAVDLWQTISSAQAHTGNQSYHDFIATGSEEYGYQGGVPLTQSF
ncbi:MAG: hypothetical protein WAW96_11290, partial [Alphaproteobacteria bacterium]